MTASPHPNTTSKASATHSGLTFNTHNPTTSVMGVTKMDPSQVETKAVYSTNTLTHLQSALLIAPTPLSPRINTCSLCGELTYTTIPTTTYNTASTSFTTATGTAATISQTVSTMTQIMPQTTENHGGGSRKTLGDRLAIPLWAWAAIIVAALLIVSFCAIFCTICLYFRSSKSNPREDTQQNPRRESRCTLVNGSEGGDNTSTIESLYPSQETRVLKEGRSVSRWDSLRKSWSRRSSRKRFSTFKPQLYPREQKKVEERAKPETKPKPLRCISEPETKQHLNRDNYHGNDQESVPTPAILRPWHVEEPSHSQPSNTGFGNQNYHGGIPLFNQPQHSPETRHSQHSISYDSQNCYYQGDASLSQQPLHVIQEPNPAGQSQLSYASYNYQGVASPSQQPWHVQDPNTACLSNNASQDYQGGASLTHQPWHIPESNSTEQQQHFIVNAGYGSLNNNHNEGNNSVVSVESANSYCNPLFEMKVHPVGSQGNTTEPSPSQTFRNSKFIIENTLNFSKRQST